MSPFKLQRRFSTRFEKSLPENTSIPSSRNNNMIEELNLGAPKGFLVSSPVTMPASSKYNPVSTLLENKMKLQQLFPTIPSDMVKILLLRMKGNCREVAKYLSARGWTSSGTIATLPNEENEHFKHTYYFGKWDKQYKNLVAKSHVGSFLTALIISESGNYDSYVLLYLDADRKVQSLKIPSPAIPVNKFSELHLTNPIIRPISITMGALVPFL